ncbi:MAG: hypothetical protein ACQESE_02155 [Nanobdellota archaeon]
MRWNKAQAAVEFLMTYGWAILAMGVVIAALSQFGMFNLQDHVPNQCKLGEEFICDVASLDETGDLYMEFTSSHTLVNVSKVFCEYDDGTKTNGTIDNMVLKPGKSEVVRVCNPDSAPAIDEKERVRLKMVYREEDEDGAFENSFDHVAHGEVITSVMEVSGVDLDYDVS